MKIISHTDIVKLNIAPLLCYEWVDTIIRQKNALLLPPKISLKPQDGVFYNTMPSILPAYGYAGVKVVTRYPGRVPSLDSEILLYDLATGSALALLDGNFITTMRTGAVAAHSIKLLAKPQFTTIGLIGLGNTVRATLKVLLALYPERALTIRLLAYKDQHDCLRRDFSAYRNLSFVDYDKPDELVRGCDVIVSGATVLTEDLCSDDCFDAGCLVVPIHTRGFGNCDLFFDKVFADDTGHVKSFKYFDRFKSYAEVTDVLTGTATGRDNDAQRILAYNIGISVHDIYYAGQIAAMVSDCQHADLQSPVEKFWI